MKQELNALRIETIERLTKEERRDLINKIRKKGLSFQKISDLTGIKKSTLIDWNNPSRDYDRKRPKKIHQVLDDFKKYLNSNENYFNKSHLSELISVIRRLEAIKNRLELEKVNEEF